MATKSKGEELKAKLFAAPLTVSEALSEKDKKAVHDFCEGYKAFLDAGKTEREVVEYTIGLLEKAGYTEFSRTKEYKAGDKFYKNNRGKALIMVTVGKKPLSEGVRIGASHIDSPRLDFKPNPLYEEGEMAYFKTHYYGGIKKYQWTVIPLSLHGVVVKKDGTTVKVNIGEDENDPVFCVTDLLIHLAQDQMKKTLAEGVNAEQLNILLGCGQYDDEKVSEKTKLNIAAILFDKYGITESDFLSAELCAVPAFKARDLGLDRSMIGSYGHDDRVCAYTSLMAEIEAKAPEHTTVTVFADKEETGSEGVTGLNSNFLTDFIEDLAQMQGVELRHVLENSKCLSADVNAAFDPTFSDVYDKRNSACINKGVVITKYTGARGKSSTNDASAEMMGFVRALLDGDSIVWQTGELGKVDHGGGGTVAKYVAHHNIETVDLGVPVLSMHAPFEVVSKADTYMAYRAVKAFYK